MGLKHPCHEHPLILRILSDNCEQACRLCLQYIHGPTYCCEGCDYYFHGSCSLIELPPEIRHPEHPHHPLTLSDTDGHPSYSCRECSNSGATQALTAIATLPPVNEEEEEEDLEQEREEEYRDGDDDIGEEEGNKDKLIWHFSHEHPLTSFHVEMVILATCRGCERTISGQVYGCRACIFLLHASCARSPRVIDHHPLGSRFTLAQYDDDAHADKCRGCDEAIRGGFVYSCLDASGGSITLHMVCALSTRFPQGHDSSNFMMHHSHACLLMPFHIEKGAYVRIRCRVCESRISGEFLGCPKCAWFIDKSCAEKLQEVIHHYLHPDHSLRLVHSVKLTEQPPKTAEDYHRCASCYRPFEDDMAFHCESCEFHLHPGCALQTLADVEEGMVASISHFAHGHPLKLHYIEQSYHRSCITCGVPILGYAYSCITCDSISFHKSCLELPHELEHALHPKHPLLMSKTSAEYFHCSVCLKKSRGYAYFCAECEFYLDVRCAEKKLTLKHHRHEHGLAYFRVVNHQLQCNACRKICKTDFYSCVPCDFRLHHDCLPLLPEITHECHVHSLSLRDKFVEGDPNYQYCDHCSELRNPAHGVYRCEECWFSAHIDCVISKDEAEVEVDQEEVETSEKPVAEPANSERARLVAVVHVTKRVIDTTRRSLDAAMKELEKLDMERKSLPSC